MTNSIGVISYATSAVFFLILSLVLFTGRWGRTQKTWFAYATMACFLWSATAAYQALYDTTLLVPHFFELLRNLAVLLLFLHILNIGNYASNVKSGTLHFIKHGVYVISSLLFLSIIFQYYLASSSLGMTTANITHAGFLSLSVVGLVLVEQLLRNSRPEALRAIKYLCLGIGGMFAYDLYLYADALLFQRVNSSLWYARGFVNAMIVPILGITVARDPQLSPDIFVSRRIVFHTTAIFGAGIYLLAIGLGGYYVRYYGGEWGMVAQITFFFGALVVLLGLMFSVPLRARLRVLINKHFFHYKYDYREEWLRFIRTLSIKDPGTQFYQRALQALAQIIDSPGGILWMCRDSGSFEMVTHWNMDEPSPPAISADSSLVSFLRQREWVVNLDEYERDAEPSSIPGELKVPEWLRNMASAWLVVPLIHNEKLLGFVVLSRSPSQERYFNWEDCDLLKTAGRQAASHLAQYEASKALAEARQFEAFNRLSAYVVHDLKNLVAQLSLIVSNATKHRHNPRFMEDTIHTVDNTVAKMNNLLAHLRGGISRREHVAMTGLDDLLKEVVHAQAVNKPAPQLHSMASGVNIKADKERLSAVIGHIIQNAQDATPDDGSINVRAMKNGKYVIVEVEDTGCGMDNLFIKERLFRPFDTTKGSSGMGIGVYEAREYLHALGGDIQVESQPQKGTMFRIRIPFCEHDNVELRYKSGTL